MCLHPPLACVPANVSKQVCPSKCVQASVSTVAPRRARAAISSALAAPSGLERPFRAAGVILRLYTGGNWPRPCLGSTRRYHFIHGPTALPPLTKLICEPICEPMAQQSDPQRLRFGCRGTQSRFPLSSPTTSK